MRKIAGFIILIISVIASNCTKEWEEHYEKTPGSLNVKLWDTLQTMERYSDFVKYARQFKLDTIIKSSNTKTLFIPGNEAFSEFLKGDTTGFNEIMRYHIIPTLFMLRNVQNNYKLPTLEKKYALITFINNAYYFNDIEITYSSPFYLDGKFYETDSVIIPKPNLYQYLKRNNPSIHKYILSQDSIILDKEKSKPKYFNEQGQTVYDSVITIINLFEEKYFAISEEYRDISATLVLPDQTTYENALDQMAGVLGGSYTSHLDIPVAWQNKVLIPLLLHKGIYGGLLEPVDFLKKKIPNIIGDSVIIDFSIKPDSRYMCSNGLTYNYASFTVNKNLYKEYRLEAENVVEPIGLNKYIWNDEFVKVEGTQKFQPVESAVAGASNDTVVDVKFDPNYKGEYTITFLMKNVFPNKYRLIWRTNYRTSGIYSIYVNDKLVKLGIAGYDQFDTSTLTAGFFSVLGIKLYPDSKNSCNIDGWVDIEEFGDVSVKLKYLSPGRVTTSNGFNADYIELVAP